MDGLANKEETSVVSSSERQGLTWVGERSEEAWARGDVGRREGGTRRASLFGPSAHYRSPGHQKSVVLALLGHPPARVNCTVPG